MPEFHSLSQILFFVASSIALVVWAIAQLIRMMGTGYGSIIVALQTQNTQQATQMAALDQGQRECREQHRACEQKTQEQEKKITEQQTKIEDLERSVSIIEHRLEDKADKPNGNGS